MKPISHRVVSFFCVVVLAVFLFSYVFASTPRDALLYRSPALDRAEEDLVFANDKLGVLSSLNVGASVTPSATYRDIIGDETAAGEDIRGTFTPNLSGRLFLEYRYDEVTTVQNQRAVLRAEQNVIKLERDGIVEALAAHIELLRAQTVAEGVEEALLDAQNDFVKAEEGFAANTLTRNQLNQARLTLERAELARDGATDRLDEALATAASYNLSAPATFEFFLFSLPEVNPSALRALRERQLTVEEARINLDNLYYLETFSAASLSMRYSTRGVGAGASVGIFDSEPGANLNLNFPGTAAPEFQFGVSATIGFDTDRLAELRQAEVTLQRAEEDLATFSETLAEDLIISREEALFAEQDLLLALEAFDLDTRIVADSEQLVADLTTALESATAEEADAKKKELDTATTNLERANTNLARSEDVVYQKWLTYTQRVRDYLARAEAGFIVADAQ